MGNNISTDKLLRIVRGNAFAIKFGVKAIRVDGTEIQDFVLGESNATLLLTGGGIQQPVPFEVDGNNAIVRFDGHLTDGYYGCDMSGTFRGEAWRFSTKILFQIVETSQQANIPEGCILYDDTYIMEVGVTMWLIGPQADWDETDPTKPDYIKNKPNLSVYATEQELEQGLAGKQNTIEDLQTIRNGAASGATAYQKPGGGIPESDLDSETQEKIDNGASAYHQPSGGIPKTDMSQGVQDSLGAADTAYQKPQGGIPKTDLDSGVQASLGKADTAIQDVTQIETDIDNIEKLIPQQATEQNQLADKEFVNSSISTATATYRGAYNLVSDLSLTTSATEQQISAALATKMAGLSITPDNNDYCFVQIPTADATPTQIARVDRYKYNGTAWLLEYSLNNSGFTAAQWAALNSGITSGLVTKLSDLPTNSELTTLFGDKQDTISDLQTIREGAAAGATAYQKPSSGIPESDLDSPTQQKIDGAEQSSNKVTSLSGSSTDTQYPSAKCTYDLIKSLQDVVADLETIAEGYVRVAGSSSPALSYKSYKYHEQGGFGRESVFHLFYPCLIGTKMTGDDAQVGKILHILQKLDYGHDIYGNARLIDGSEGDVMICNIEPYYRIIGKHTIDGTEYDVFLMSRNPFTWQGIEAERVEKFGMAPDFCVNHTDTDNVVRMHSVYNPAWNGSYTDPVGVTGKYVYSVDAETGDIVETYDADATLLGGAGGLHSTDISLPNGEQYAMNNNPDTTKCVPFMNHTAAGVENMFALMLAEGGTFDAHNATLMGSGFSSNDGATAAADWEESGNGAKNGFRVKDKNDTWKYYTLGGNVRFLFGESTGTKYAANCINSWRNPFHIMEAHRAVSYAIQNGVHELEWFVFEGNKYKYRSVNGFNGPAQGEMTCVVWKLFATKAGSAAVDPTDGTTSIAGNRVELLVSVALFHGMTTQVSPSWWTSGLIFTEDENQNYEAYMEREQEALIKSENGEISTSENFNFETLYKHVGSFTVGEGYRKNYSNDALMLPDSNSNKTGGGLHTYVCGYNYFSGSAASANKKLVRGFRRGNSASVSNLSPLTLLAFSAPSSTLTNLGFGTCVRILE